MPKEGTSYGGSLYAPKYNVSSPLSLSQSTAGSVAARTSWRSNEAGGTPSAYSKRTRQSTLSWDDDGQGPSLPESDKGASFGRG